MHDGYARHDRDAPSDARGRGGLIIGMDMAPALAIVGMLAVHTGSDEGISWRSLGFWGPVLINLLIG